MYEINEIVNVVVERERGGGFVRTEPGMITCTGERKVSVLMKNGKKKRVAYSSISKRNGSLADKKLAIQLHGYTICNHGEGTYLEGWFALLPGETKFFDNIDEVEESNFQIEHQQNYLGFFSSEKNLIEEIYDSL